MESPLRIALISTERLWQGGEEQAWQLALGLRERGHTCTAVALADRPFARRLAAGEFPVIPLGSKFPWPWQLASLRSVLRRRDIQVAYFNDAHAITLGGLAAWHLPSIVTVAARRANFPIRSPGRYRRLCDRIFCVSQAARQRCLEAGLPDQLLRLVYDGVDPERMAAGDRERGRKALQVGPQQRLLLSVGSLVPCKGHRVLIDAMPAVLRHHQDVRLVIAGAGGEEAALRAQISQLDLAAHVRLLGFRRDIPDLMHACDLFVFPSVDEGLGSTLIDAMLAERAIVTTDAGGIPEVVGCDTAGQSPCAAVVECGSAQALSAAIVAALSDPQTASHQARQGRQRAFDLFTVDHMVESSIVQFRAALNERGGPVVSRHTPT